MKCPYCNVDMLEGYLITGKTMWSTKKHAFSMLIGNDEKYAFKLGAPIFSPHNVRSTCCPKCKRIIIDSAAFGNNLSCNEEK